MGQKVTMEQKVKIDKKVTDIQCENISSDNSLAELSSIQLDLYKNIISNGIVILSTNFYFHVLDICVSNYYDQKQ